MLMFPSEINKGKPLPAPLDVPCLLYFRSSATGTGTSYFMYTQTSNTYTKNLTIIGTDIMGIVYAPKGVTTIKVFGDSESYSSIRITKIGLKKDGTVESETIRASSSTTSITIPSDYDMTYLKIFSSSSSSVSVPVKVSFL